MGSHFYDPIADFYSRPQVGSGIAIYQGGNRKQVGGGIFASIQRFVVPILWHIGQKLLSIAPDVGSKAMEVVKDTIADVRKGKRLGEAIKSNVAEKIQKTLDEYSGGGRQQSGSGRRKFKKKRKNKKKKKKPSISRGINKKRKKRKSVTRKKYRDIFG